MGHSWQPLQAAWLQNSTIEQVLGCSRCEAKRIQILDQNGYVLSGHYAYLEGYAFKGLGRLDADDRAIMRRTAVAKLLD